MPIIGNQTLMDLALPGTHDTLTYDLSTTVADSANDLPSVVSWFLHEFSWALPIEWLGETVFALKRKRKLLTSFNNSRRVFVSSTCAKYTRFHRTSSSAQGLVRVAHGSDQNTNV